MKIQCPYCKHIACNACARLTWKIKQGVFEYSGGADITRKCCACKIVNPLRAWKEIKDPQPHPILTHPDLFLPGETRMKKG